MAERVAAAEALLLSLKAEVADLGKRVVACQARVPRFSSAPLLGTSHSRYGSRVFLGYCINFAISCGSIVVSHLPYARGCGWTWSGQPCVSVSVSVCVRACVCLCACGGPTCVCACANMCLCVVAERWERAHAPPPSCSVGRGSWVRMGNVGRGPCRRTDTARSLPRCLR
jgi:hypothetical protein